MKRYFKLTYQEMAFELEMKEASDISNISVDDLESKLDMPKGYLTEIDEKKYEVLTAKYNAQKSGAIDILNG